MQKKSRQPGHASPEAPRGATKSSLGGGRPGGSGRWQTGSGHTARSPRLLEGGVPGSAFQDTPLLARLLAHGRRRRRAHPLCCGRRHATRHPARPVCAWRLGVGGGGAVAGGFLRSARSSAILRGARLEANRPASKSELPRRAADLQLHEAPPPATPHPGESEPIPAPTSTSNV